MSPVAKEFREHIRRYNAAFAFTSLGVNIDQTVLDGNGPYVFRIHGGLYHRLGALNPEPGATASYAQLYILAPEDALARRISANEGQSGEVMAAIQAMLLAHNAYVGLYQQAHEILQGQPHEDVTARLHFTAARDQ